MPKQFSDLNFSSHIKSDYRIKNCGTNGNRKSDSVDFTNATDLGLAKNRYRKTAAFGLPLLQLIDTQIPTVQAVILVPTRELGHQILET
jgi:ATP-dependent RNA helicase DeaD